MNFSFYIAKRYLFSKKRQNVINLVSFISVCGVAVGTMALVCVLSVFNGFQGVIEGLFSNFDPPMQIISSKGKCFEPDSVKQVLEHEYVDTYCAVIEDNALIQYADKQLPIKIKGVPNNYTSINNIDSILIDGSFYLNDPNVNTAVAGIGLVRALGASVHFVEPLWLYVPKRSAKVNLMKPDKAFHREFLYLSGVFMVQQEKYDNNLMLVSLALARKLFEYPTQVTSIELKLKDGIDYLEAKHVLNKLAGDDFILKDRYEQQAEFYSMLQIEKWVTYLILSFILLIAVFNIIGSLSMLIIDKKQDVLILQHLGASKATIKRIFLLEGWMISVVGAIIGVILGLLLCWLQYQFGLISLGGGEGFVIQDYPVSVQFLDVVVIFLTVVVMGLLAAIYPTNYFYKKQ
ncbi:MAG: ABC transporter permease [Paludibacteraceae bacterium]|nr:ABC transporter permease [Paludibacteraceae bacterium]